LRRLKETFLERDDDDDDDGSDGEITAWGVSVTDSSSSAIFLSSSAATVAVSV